MHVQWLSASEIGTYLRLFSFLMCEYFVTDDVHMPRLTVTVRSIYITVPHPCLRSHLHCPLPYAVLLWHVTLTLLSSTPFYFSLYSSLYNSFSISLSLLNSFFHSFLYLFFYWSLHLFLYLSEAMNFKSKQALNRYLGKLDRGDAGVPEDGEIEAS